VFELICLGTDDSSLNKLFRVMVGAGRDAASHAHQFKAMVSGSSRANVEQQLRHNREHTDTIRGKTRGVL
jgi:hypothetical protein